MKRRLLCGLLILSGISGYAQEKISQEQARLICAQEMASFTKLVSPSYQKGISFSQFQLTLCGNLQPTREGVDQLKVAYNFLLQGTANEVIVRTYNGKEMAASLNYLLNAHKKGIESDGAELFGGKTGTSNSSFAKNAEGGCKWYQVWCLMQSVASWLVLNWPGVSQVVDWLNSPVIAAP